MIESCNMAAFRQSGKSGIVGSILEAKNILEANNKQYYSGHAFCFNCTWCLKEQWIDPFDQNKTYFYDFLQLDLGTKILCTSCKKKSVITEKIENEYKLKKCQE